MATFVNDRYVRLQATAPRYVSPAPLKKLDLSSTTLIFKFVAGTSSPALATLNATPLGITGVATWSILGGTLTGTGDNVRTIAASSLTGESVTVTATIVDGGVSYSGTVTIAKVSDGANGASGSPVYTWIKYATSSAGAGLSDSPTDMTYIGLAFNKPTATESTVAADYVWSLIKGADGAQGNQGVPGAPGADGLPTYTWIKYADVADGTGLYDTPTAATLYIGIAPNKTVQAESATKTDYVWSKFRGDQGVPGTNGTNGTNGSNGADGSRGAGQYFATGSAWSDTTADAATPGANIAGDVVTISNGTTFIGVKGWSGSAWVAVAPTYDGGAIFPGTVTANKVNANSLIIRDASGNPLLGVGVPLAAGYEAPGTKNSDIALGVNIIPSNALPSSTAGFTASASVAGFSWEGPLYEGPGNAPHGFDIYSPLRAGCVYVHAIGTPNGDTFIDIYKDLLNPYPVIAGRRYEFSIALRAVRCDSQVRANWYSAAGAFISEVGGAHVLSSGTATYADADFTYSTLFETAPPGAAKAMIYARQQHNGSGDAYTFASQFHVGEAGATQVVRSKWFDSPAGLSAAAAAANNAINHTTTGLAQRLRANAVNVLSGGGAVTIGSLTVDSAGSRTGGNGVGMTGKGIALYAPDGAPTITMDAATGAVAVAGNISGSTGNFSGSLGTSNYAEDGSGNPTAGARLSAAGTAVKVANNGLQIGSAVFSDYWARLVQAVDGSVSSGYFVWRGNNDTTTRGGAANIDCLSLFLGPGWQSGGAGDAANLRFKWRLQPSAVTDNLDSMRHMEMEVYGVSGGSLIVLEYTTLSDRLYYSSTHSNANNAAWGQFTVSLRRGNLEGGITHHPDFPATFYGHLRTRIWNAYGPSAWKWFHGSGAGASNSIDAQTIADYTSPPGAPAAGGGGGGGGSGGQCPAPWVKVRLEGGHEIEASQLYSGVKVQAVSDTTLKPIIGGGTVSDVQTVWKLRYRLKLTNGQATEWSEHHRFAIVDRGWVEIEKLLPGDHIVGLNEAIVESVMYVGEGQVVSFVVKGAGTYFGGGLLCHNLKLIP